MYSFFASCKKLGINPRHWLTDILERIPDYSIKQIDDLLPHKWKSTK
ncbi:MAG: transposase domain-containing protein [Bacteroidota bacterium]